jgi:hypothetical protein
MVDLELRNNNNNSSAEAVALVAAALEAPARQEAQEWGWMQEAVALEAPARQQPREWGWMQEVDLVLTSELAERRRGPPEHDEESRPNGLVVAHKGTPLSYLLQSKALCC